MLCKIFIFSLPDQGSYLMSVNCGQVHWNGLIKNKKTENK